MQAWVPAIALPASHVDTKPAPTMSDAIVQVETIKEAKEATKTPAKPIEKKKSPTVKKVAPVKKKVVQKPKATVKRVQPSGTCADWIRAAGIADIASANELIRRESGCNPYARNSSSGACGVAQELPCGKSGCSIGDGACQIRWMSQYVKQRYGSWANAVAFHDRNNWY